MESFRPHRGFILNLSKGFTLIELLVVFAIITIVSAVVLTSQSSFNKTLILSNTAYDIALALRSAESRGLGSRVAGGETNAGYGLHFELSKAGFILFSDSSPLPNASNCHGIPRGDANAPDAKPGDCVYNGVAEKVTDYAFGNGIMIKDLCAYSIAWTCGQSSLDIVFSRPNPDPFVRVDNDLTVPYYKACIAITSPQGGAGYVSVTASGQITANATSCP